MSYSQTSSSSTLPCSWTQARGHRARDRRVLGDPVDVRHRVLRRVNDMPSAPTHIVATSAIAAFFHRPRVPWHLWFFGAVLALAPDLDEIVFRYGVKYAD